MNNYEIKIEPYMQDLSDVSDYLDRAEFHLLTQIEPYKKGPSPILPSSIARNS